MTEIRIPTLNANDDTYLLTEWLAADGQPVRSGDPVAVVETSKAAEELVSAGDGVLLQLVPAGGEYAPDTVIGRLFASVEEWRGFVERSGTAEPAGGQDTAGADAAGGNGAGPVITAPARALLDELGIPTERLAELAPDLRGLRVVRRADVERLAAGRRAAAAPAVEGTPVEGQAAEGEPVEGQPGEPVAASGRVHALPRVQQAVAAVVERSHQTVPAAFVAARVDVAAALALARDLTPRLRVLVGLPELLVAAVARLHERFPLCFAAPQDGRAVRLADAPHVGVTVDVGKGLYVPVVRDAARRPVGEIARELMRFRVAALRGAFRPQDLAGANILVALHNEGGVTVAVPMVFPGHTCAVSLTATHQEPAVDASGRLTVRPVVNLGLAYDHRVLNGRDAVEFLEALRAVLQSPEQLGHAAG